MAAAKNAFSLLSLLALGFLISGDGFAADELSSYEKTLVERNVEATTDGLNTYFRQLHPDTDQQRRIAALIQQLGSTDSFSAREAAMHQLLVLPQLPFEALANASKQGDPEIRWRAKIVLEKGREESRRVLYAVFKTIEQNEIGGTTSGLLRALPLCDKDLCRAAQRALKASVAQADKETLLAGLKSTHEEVRIAAVLALGKAAGNDSAQDISALLRDQAVAVRLAACEALADLGDRDSLAPLVELLAATDVGVRARSVSILRQLSGQRFQFTAYDTPEKRAAGVAKWKAWTGGEGKTAELNFPLTTLDVLLGRTLVCYSNKVVEFDANGRKTWETDATAPWGVYGLPDGRRFVASYSNRTVDEYDGTGKHIKKHKLPGNPYDVQVLDNGNFLIPSYDTSRAYEIDTEGNNVWENKDGKPVGATRLENGNTLVCFHDKGEVIEYDETGTDVWRVKSGPQPYTAQRLENGNTMVFTAGNRTATEYDPSGGVVWKLEGLQGYDAQRLPNGNTLVCRGGVVQEVNRDNNVVWKVTASATRIHRY